MRNCATFAEQFAQLIAPISYPGAPLMFPNGQMPPVPLPQMEPVGGKRKSRGGEDGEGKKKRKSKPKDPNAPKRPPSSYLLFQNEVRQELKAKHPNIPNNELLAKISKAWNDMPKEQKDVCLHDWSGPFCSIYPHCRRGTKNVSGQLRVSTWSRKSSTSAAAKARLPPVSRCVIPFRPSLPAHVESIGFSGGGQSCGDSWRIRKRCVPRCFVRPR